jgi:putative zinc finger/helix-turn-helix YgiT family protein
MTERLGDYAYPLEVPVTLRGVRVASCPKCGEHEVDIPRVEELHRAIARAVIAKPQRLAPVEIRFLRKHLGLAAQDFARHVGTTPETVSRWEKGAKPMGQVADRLLRLMVALRDGLGYSLESLKSVGRSAARPMKLRLQRKPREGWSMAA